MGESSVPEGWQACKRTTCRWCASSNVIYEVIEDLEPHEDSHYRCLDCAYEWWVDGIDS